MSLLETLMNRRSIRKYTDEPIPEEKLNAILQAGLLAPSSRGLYPVEFILVRDKKTLARLSKCKSGGAFMLRCADAAIVVIGDAEKSDVWVEDCSIAMTLMHAQAAELGIGSCWIQIRKRTTTNEWEIIDSERAVRRLLGIPEEYGVLAVLSLGNPAEEKDAYPLPEVTGEKIHREGF